MLNYLHPEALAGDYDARMTPSCSTRLEWCCRSSTTKYGKLSRDRSVTGTGYKSGLHNGMHTYSMRA